MYLAGYAVECFFENPFDEEFPLPKSLRTRNKAGDSKEFIRERDGFTHQLETLMELTQGRDRLRQNGGVWQTFARVNYWIPAWRYSPDPSSQKEASALLAAVDDFLHWIDVKPLGANSMSDDRIGKKIYNILKTGYFDGPDDAVYISNGFGDNLHVLVVSEKFQGKGIDEKQDLIFSDLVNQLPQTEWTRVSLTIGVSPDEILAS